MCSTTRIRFSIAVRSFDICVLNPATVVVALLNALTDALCVPHFS